MIVGGDFQVLLFSLSSVSLLTSGRLFGTDMISMLPQCRRSIGAWLISMSTTVGLGLLHT